MSMDNSTSGQPSIYSNSVISQQSYLASKCSIIGASGSLVIFCSPGCDISTVKKDIFILEQAS